MTQEPKWKEGVYRKYEQLLTKFKKGEIGYSIFIECIQSTIEQTLQSQREEDIKAVENLKGMYEPAYEKEDQAIVYILEKLLQILRKEQ